MFFFGNKLHYPLQLCSRWNSYPRCAISQEGSRQVEQCQGRVTGLCLLPRGIQLDFVADTGVPVERRNRELCGIRVNLHVYLWLVLVHCSCFSCRTFEVQGGLIFLWFLLHFWILLLCFLNMNFVMCCWNCSLVQSHLPLHFVFVLFVTKLLVELKEIVFVVIGK